MPMIEKSKKTSKKQKIDRRSNLEQKYKNLIYRSEVCKIEDTKDKGKSLKDRPLGEGGAQRTGDRFLSSHHFPRKSPKDRLLGEGDARRTESRFLLPHHLPKEKSERPSPPLDKGVPEGRRIDFSHPIIFPSKRTIDGFPISTYKKAPATRIGASGISICIAFWYPRNGTRSKMPNPLTMNVRAK